MPPSALTSDNSAIVMIDHAAGFGNVFRSHDISLHVNNTVGLAKTAGVFGIRPAEVVASAQPTERADLDLVRHTQVRVR